MLRLRFLRQGSPKPCKCAPKVHLAEPSKKPRTAGLCGGEGPAHGHLSLSSAFIERVNKGRKPLEQGMVRRKNTLSKGSFLHRRSSIHKALSHIAHKRRNTRFNGLWRVHTPPQPLNAHTAAHRANGAGKRGAALRGTFESTKICAKRFQIRDGEKPREQNNSRQTVAAWWWRPGGGGWTQSGGAAGPQARAAWTLLFPQL